MQLTVNGQSFEVADRHAETPLLWVLRDVLRLRGVKFGCGAGWCAACTVLVDGRAAKSCQTPLSRVGERGVITADGATGPVADAVRDAWHRGNVVQCGYCQPGQIMAATALLATSPDPDDARVNVAMNGNLCRCGTYPRIRAAIHSAAATLAQHREVPPLVVVEPPVVPPLSADLDADRVSPYLQIYPDGSIVVFCSQIEMGQGVFTGVATIVADELDADLAAVHVVHAANNTARYGNLLFGNLVQGTSGSTSAAGFWIRYRQAAAVERARLLLAAAERWGVPTQEIEITSGMVHHPNGQQVTFGELAADLGRTAPPLDARPKGPSQYRLIGHEGVLRVDSPAKILGTATYTLDVAWPGMLTAVVLHPPRFGATVHSVDDAAARAVPGVLDVIPISRGVAVLGETFHDANLGRKALMVDWDESGAEKRGTAALVAEHRRLAESGQGATLARAEGDVTTAWASSERIIEAVYELPYLAHAPMEPDNAACRMREDGVLEVWVGSQAPDYARDAAAEAAGLPKERVEIHVTLAGGAFGLRVTGASEPVVEAVEIARALDWRHPVKVQWPREEEFKSGRFRPMSVHRLRAAVDGQGNVTAYDHRLVVQSVMQGMPILRDVLIRQGVDGKSVEGAVDQPYSYPNLRVDVVDVPTGIPVLPWRSVGNSHTEFARESLLDEVAAATGQDPLEIRRKLLGASPRTLTALEIVAEQAGWGSQLPQGRARGLAASNGFGTHSAQVVEISQDDRGRIRVERVVCAVDPGVAINPDIVRAQMEGGILFGLSAALWGEITLQDGAVVQQNFGGYSVVRMRTTPRIDVHVIPSTESPGGVGEAGVPSVAPALAGALAALTGTRIRVLPLSKASQPRSSGPFVRRSRPGERLRTASGIKTAYSGIRSSAFDSRLSSPSEERTMFHFDPTISSAVRSTAGSAHPEQPPAQGPLTAELLDKMQRYWQAANFLSIGQIYLQANPLLREPLRVEHIKPRLLGHWGTSPGLSFIYVHLNRLIAQHDLDVIYLAGPGHGGPALVANVYLEGTYTERYPEVTRDVAGLGRLVRQFSTPGGIPSHVSVTTPGSIHEGGELGYVLAHAFGAAFDNPDLIVAAVIGDGEAETGPLAGSWKGTSFLDPARDGAVLPILHLNGYKIANPTVLGRSSDDDVRAQIEGNGYEVHLVEGDDPARMHQAFAAALDTCYSKIRDIQQEARGQILPEGSPRDPRPRWPAIVLRTPKGWTGPKEVGGLPVEGTFRAHQVPLDAVRANPEQLAMLETWLRSYHPHELFDRDGRLIPELADLAPKGDHRMGANPHANGGKRLVDLDLPDYRAYAIAVTRPATERHESTRQFGKMARDIYARNAPQANFRLFCPDELKSNRLDDVFAVENRCFVGRTTDIDDHVAASGRVMEVLSEHLCEGWLEGYLLTGRHGVYVTYEAFAMISASMTVQHTKWLEGATALPWRESISSLNILLSSTCWRNDHNGFSHQGPGLIDVILSKRGSVARIYLPPDANCLLSVANHCLRSRNYVNLIVIDKQPQLQWLDMDTAIEHCARGAGVWHWASNDREDEPDVVLACAGDVPTLETIAAAHWLRQHAPEMKVRVVNVVDLMALFPREFHPHGLDQTTFVELFTAHTPVVFAFHGYQRAIHALVHGRPNAERFHVRGFNEQGTTTTPFDMVVLNGMSRYHLAAEALRRSPRMRDRAPGLIDACHSLIAKAVAYSKEHLEDTPEIQNWVWSDTFETT